MTVLLPTDDVGVWNPQAQPDAHGWAEPGVPTLVWAGLGAVQESPPAASDQANEEAGGSGPYDPTHARLAVVYLPSGVQVEPGFVVEARGLEWVVQRVRFVPDPAGLGLDVVVVDVAEQRAVA